MFAVWDVPAMRRWRPCALADQLPMTTIDLGNEAATELAAGG